MPLRGTLSFFGLKSGGSREVGFGSVFENLRTAVPEQSRSRYPWSSMGRSGKRTCIVSRRPGFLVCKDSEQSPIRSEP
ncbi:MAG: hypothetical protein MZU97_12065 [Bacillus subtilis]|nr:hypothetical protein [Bacillus subtilis]